MKISGIENNSYNISFNAGYNSKIKTAEKIINPKNLELFFKNSSSKDFRSFYNIDLKDNKAIALGNSLCAKIFEELRKFYDFRQNKSIQTLIYPHDIYVFNETESSILKNKDFFVNIANLRFNKRKPTFEAGTIFMNNKFNSLEEMNDFVELSYKNRKISTNHFLHHFIHEWMHSTFTNIAKARAFAGSYSFEKTMQNYSKQKLNNKEKELVQDVLGSYPTNCEDNQYSETFAESWTKFICESLCEDCKSFKNNPTDVLKSTPKEFQELLKKVSDIKMLNLFDMY